MLSPKMVNIEIGIFLNSKSKSGNRENGNRNQKWKSKSKGHESLVLNSLSGGDQKNKIGPTMYMHLVNFSQTFDCNMSIDSGDPF